MGGMADAGDMVVTKEDEVSAPWSCPQVEMKSYHVDN